MPDVLPNPPADGQQGGAPADGGESGGAGAPKPEGTLTQAQFDSMIESRLAQERKKYADYDDIKAKAKAHDEAEAANATELEKAQKAAKVAEDKAAAAEQRVQSLAKRTSLIGAASAAKAADADIVADLLIGSDAVTVDADGKVSGAKEAVEALLKDKPFLKASVVPGQSGGEFSGTDSKSIDEQIRTLEQKGDRASLAQARSLKLSKPSG